MKKKQVFKMDTRWRKFRLDESPDRDLYAKFNKLEKDVLNTVTRYENKADVDTALHTFMVGLHGKLKKKGYKV